MAEIIKKLKRVVLKEELMALTGSVNHAIVLNQMLYWSERVADSDQFIKEEIERARNFSDGSQETIEDIEEYLLNGWIYKKAEDLVDECMEICSRQTMNRVLDDLVKSGWLEKRKNPKYKWDRTLQYRVNLVKIQRDLQKIGYSLEGYSLLGDDEISNAQNGHSNKPVQNHEPSNAQNGHSINQIEHMKTHDGQAIPETTTEIKTKITTTTDTNQNHDTMVTEETSEQKDVVVVDKPLAQSSIKPQLITKEEIKKIKELARTEGIKLTQKNIMELWAVADGDIEQIGNGIKASVQYATKYEVRNMWGLIKDSVAAGRIPALSPSAQKLEEIRRKEEKYRDIYVR